MSFWNFELLYRGICTYIPIYYVYILLVYLFVCLSYYNGDIYSGNTLYMVLTLNRVCVCVFVVRPLYANYN